MLDELIKREDVCQLLREICNNHRYFKKKNSDSVNYQLFVDIEQVLFLFYDALFKYKVIIEDIYYFDEYLEQLGKLFKKLNNVSDINEGINRVLGSSCIKKLNLKDQDKNIAKENVLRYIYDKYIVNGYFLHGYAGSYSSSLREEGMIIDEYKNLYDKFLVVQEILSKHNALDIMDKDFSKKEIYFTDSMVMGCYYAVNAPMYFYKLICKNKFITKEAELSAYFQNDYELCLKNISKLCFRLDLNEKEKKLIYDAFNEEWKLLKKPSSKITLLAVERKKIVDCTPFSIDEFITNCSADSLGEAIGKLVVTRNNNIVCSENINREDIQFIELLGYKKVIKSIKKPLKNTGEQSKIVFKTDDEFYFSNTYGKVSILLLIGTILIMAGVILTIILIWRGI